MATWCQINNAYHKVKANDASKTECNLNTADKVEPKVDPTGNPANAKPICSTCKSA